MSHYPALRGPVEDGQVLKVAPGATWICRYNLLENVTRYVIPESCANIAYSLVLNCICKTRRVPRCLQHLQNASHVRHGNGGTLRGTGTPRDRARNDVKLGYWLIWLLGSWSWLSKSLIIRQRDELDYQSIERPYYNQLFDSSYHPPVTVDYLSFQYVSSSSVNSSVVITSR